MNCRTRRHRPASTAGAGRDALRGASASAAAPLLEPEGGARMG